MLLEPGHHHAQMKLSAASLGFDAVNDPVLLGEHPKQAAQYLRAGFAGHREDRPGKGLLAHDQAARAASQRAGWPARRLSGSLVQTTCSGSSSLALPVPILTPQYKSRENLPRSSEKF
jgi:hypothetical protein